MIIPHTQAASGYAIGVPPCPDCHGTKRVRVRVVDYETHRDCATCAMTTDKERT